ncbi:unnamed protein product [Owenia fusiformis]|uniref:Uncharacterized protein n=1 Tax=Owenia fusiformis TaxID=6347 RepID=A0A8J1YB65_OWEFU|nr:unnamed protein product [Owenia fusiformis]
MRRCFHLMLLLGVVTFLAHQTFSEEPVEGTPYCSTLPWVKTNCTNCNGDCFKECVYRRVRKPCISEEEKTEMEECTPPCESLSWILDKCGACRCFDNKACLKYCSYRKGRPCIGTSYKRVLEECPGDCSCVPLCESLPWVRDQCGDCHCKCYGPACCKSCTFKKGKPCAGVDFKRETVMCPGECSDCWGGGREGGRSGGRIEERRSERRESSK